MPVAAGLPALLLDASLRAADFFAHAKRSSMLALTAGRVAVSGEVDCRPLPINRKTGAFASGPR